jgi:hypothetical protein
MIKENSCSLEPFEASSIISSLLRIVNLWGVQGLKELRVDIDCLTLAILPQDELAFLPTVQVVDLSF